VRQAAFEACRQNLAEFSVPGYGGAHFSKVVGHGIVSYEPDLADLHSVLADSTGSNTKKVYFVFNVLKPWHALMMAKPEIEALEASGFEVVMSYGFTKKDLLTVLGDDSTYGLILDSHGSEPFLGFGGGHWSDSNGDLITPTSIKKVSAHLKFVTALGCYGEQRADEYREYLHLSEDSFHFLAGSHSEDLIEYYFRSDVAAPYDPVAIRYGQDSSTEEDAAGAKLITQINFAQQIARLLRAETK
jgi:hypothetical protein